MTTVRKIPFHAIAAAIVALFLMFPPAVAADDTATEGKLKAVERALDEGRKKKQQIDRQAEELEREVLDLRARLITTAAAAQREEEIVSRLERALAAYEIEERARQAGLVRRKVALAATLAALERLAYLPPETLLISRTSAIDAIRSSRLLSAVVPALEAEARALGAELAALKALRGEIAAKQIGLIKANNRLVKEQRALDRLLKRTAGRQSHILDASRTQQERLARLAAEAKDLRALLHRIGRDEDERRVRESAVVALPLKPFSAARGAMPFPVAGELVLRFGEVTEFGTTSKGISLATRAGAQVIAPHDGRVVFAGPFRSYGQLLIIAHSEGYHTLIAGMAYIETIVGQWLLAGEPVGRMDDAGRSQPTLYVELRRAGEPINPLPWLAASEGKVKG